MRPALIRGALIYGRYRERVESFVPLASPATTFHSAFEATPYCEEFETKRQRPSEAEQDLHDLASVQAMPFTNSELRNSAVRLVRNRRRGGRYGRLTCGEDDEHPGVACVTVGDDDAVMEPDGPPTLSKSEVNRAGALLAQARLGAVNITARDRLDAIAVVDAWRQSHAVPLEWVTDALGRRVGPIATQCVVAQRLKRMPQIIKKLARYGNMNLARMQDLGGCRIVLPDLDQVDEAARLIASYGTNRWEVRHEADYRTEGRPDTGYRALHIMVAREQRMVEIQLRTLREHAWAEAVERVTALSEHDVKEGRAPDEFLEYFRLASDAFFAMDNHEPVSSRHRLRFRQLHGHLGRYVLAQL